MAQKYFMGIDIGTFESKGALIDQSATVIASAALPHGMESPLPGYAEHDAEAVWWGDFCALSSRLIRKSGVAPADIRAVGASTIGPCCLPVDEYCTPLGNAILYGIDVRADDEIRYIRELFGAENILRECGSDVTSQSAAAKILWMKNRRPEIYAKAAKFITGQTYIVAKLTGNYVIDRYTAASFVPIYDIHTADWDTGRLKLFCRPDQLAKCAWSCDIAGEVTDEAARQTGLAPGTPVIAGTADAGAEAFSVGVADPGDMMLTYGATIFMIHVVEQLTSDRRLWANPYHFPGTYAVTAGMSTAGTLTKWFRDNFCNELLEEQQSGGENAYARLAREAAAAAPGSGGLIVLPYFSGERTPINDPKAKGVVFGLNLLHTRGDVFRACLEGVGYGIASHFDIFEQLGMKTRKVMAVGGGTRNETWTQAVSDICGITQYTAAETIGAAYGDALMAALGIGFFKNRGDAAETIRVARTIPPNPQNTGLYLPYRENYARLYAATKDMMHEW